MREPKTFLTEGITHLLIDLDGTLLGNKGLKLSLSFARRSLMTLHQFGGFPRIAKTLFAVTRELKRPSSEMANDERLVQRFAKSMKMDLEEAKVAMQSTLEVIFPTLDKYFFPLPGALEFLEWAKDHYTLLLATNPVWPREIIELRVRWAGIDPSIFSFVTDSHEMTACKPEPRYFREILKHEGLKPSQCLFIGNETRMDLPATRVGIPVFIVSKSNKLRILKQPQSRAAAMRGTFAHLKQLLKNESAHKN